MPRGRLALVLLALTVCGAVPAAGVDGPSVPAADAQVLKSAQMTISGPALLDFFHKRTPATVPEKTLTDLAARLRERAPDEHNRAFADLVGYGPAAVPVLRQAANDLDHPDAAERARRCLQSIEGTEGAALVSTTARTLALFRPTGAAEALLAYLPYADTEVVADEITLALTGLALRDGKPEPALLKALEDPLASRRAVAATVLSQVGGSAHRHAVRKLLQDPKPVVRLRAALALAQGHDAEAVPVLINLLAELPADQARPAEDYLTRLAGEWALTIPAGGDEIARKLRRDLWAAWWRGTDGPALLDEFRKRTIADAEREKIAALVRQLDHVAPAEREKAIAGLVAVGSAAVGPLRQATNDPSFKARERAQQCLQVLDKGQAAPLPGAAARLVAIRKPAGAAEALLAYIPCAEDDNQLAEVQAALNVLVQHEGKPDPVVLRALEDRAWQRRAAAAEALAAGAAETQLLLRKLLDDPEPVVRLRVALALVSAGDRQAVPRLIALLAELPPEDALQAQAALLALAGEQAPTLTLSNDTGTAEKCRDAWAAWWKEHGAKVDLTQLGTALRLLGYTLVVEQYSQAKRSGRVFEVDAAGKMRWEVTGLQAPLDAAVGPGDRVLIAEQGASRVSERDLKGNIIWQKPINQPQAVQRLSNGHVFIAARNQLLELDRNGKEVFSHARPNNDIMAAHRHRDGQIVFLTYAWSYHRLDSTGKEVKTFRLGPFPHYANVVHFLPGDHVLLPEHNANRVVELTPEGKRVWEASVLMPNGQERLPNGNVLVCSAQGQRVVELNRAGKVVWEYKENFFNPWRARRR